MLLFEFRLHLVTYYHSAKLKKSSETKEQVDLYVVTKAPQEVEPINFLIMKQFGNLLSFNEVEKAPNEN